MTNHYAVPAAVTVLAELLVAPEAFLRDSLWADPPNLANLSLPRTQVRRHFQEIRTFAGEVVRLLNEEIAPLSMQEPTDAGRMKKAVARLSKQIHSQVQQYHAVLASGDVSGEGLNTLLVEAYRHNLKELRDWMADITDLSRAPDSFLMPGQAPTIQLVLEFTSCPALESLREHVIAPMITRVPKTGNKHPPSLWIIAGWFLVAIGVSRWLFGDDDA